MKKLVAVVFLVMSACLLFAGSATAQELVGTWDGTLDGVAYRSGYSPGNHIQLVVQDQQIINTATFFRGTMTFSSPFGGGNDLPVTGFVLGEAIHLTGDFFHGGGSFVGTTISGFLHFQKASAGISTATGRFTLMIEE